MFKTSIAQKHRGAEAPLTVLLSVFFIQIAPQSTQAEENTRTLIAGYDVRFMPLEVPDPQWADNPKLYTKVEKTVTACLEACHDHKGRSASGLMPKIEGQNYFYLFNQLKQYDKNNNEKYTHISRSNKTMNAVMSKVEQETYIYIADYISRLSCKNISDAGSTERSKPKELNKCSGCHGEDGIGISIHMPRIAGQPFLYLQKQFELFRNTDRLKPYPANADMRRSHLMSHFSHAVSALNGKQVLRYYSSLPCAG